MSSLQETIEQDYLQKVQKIMDRMDTAPHRTKAPVSPVTVMLAGEYHIAIAAACGVVFAGTSVAAGLDPSLFGLPALFGIALGGLVSSQPAIIQFGLKLFGRTLPLDLEQAEKLNKALLDEPRMVEIIGRWGANNPDGQINRYDFDKAMGYIKEKQAARRSADARLEANRRNMDREQALKSSGLQSSITRHRLSNIAGVGVDASHGTQSKPKM